MKNKKVAIVIPTHRPLKGDDFISFKHLENFLGKYDIYFLIPDNLDPKNFKKNNLKFVRFPRKYFMSWRGYNELLLQKDFYKTFVDYQYILIHQLDVLVFSDQLLNWCNKGYSYIASPWFRPVIGTLSHKKGSPASGGNGGFSLRKVENCLRVLEKVEKLAKRSTKKDYIRKLLFIRAVLTGKSHKIWLNAPADNYPFAEDGFWSLEAPKYLKNYKVAPFKEALKFGFERFPKKCFELNKRKLPFGCHAWAKFDKEFWLPYILS